MLTNDSLFYIVCMVFEPEKTSKEPPAHDHQMVWNLLYFQHLCMTSITDETLKWFFIKYHLSRIWLKWTAVFIPQSWQFMRGFCTPTASFDYVDLRLTCLLFGPSTIMDLMWFSLFKTNLFLMYTQPPYLIIYVGA